MLVRYGHALSGPRGGRSVEMNLITRLHFNINLREDAYFVGRNNAGKSSLISAFRFAAYALRVAQARPLMAK
jgi:ABC-type molybdenum transport system ATPase subunit/photorepair protein PhrA